MNSVQLLGVRYFITVVIKICCALLLWITVHMHIILIELAMKQKCIPFRTKLHSDQCCTVVYLKKMLRNERSKTLT